MTGLTPEELAKLEQQHNALQEKVDNSNPIKIYLDKVKDITPALIVEDLKKDPNFRDLAGALSGHSVDGNAINYQQALAELGEAADRYKNAMNPEVKKFVQGATNVQAQEHFIFEADYTAYNKNVDKLREFDRAALNQIEKPTAENILLFDRHGVEPSFNQQLNGVLAGEIVKIATYDQVVALQRPFIETTKTAYDQWLTQDPTTTPPLIPRAEYEALMAKQGHVSDKKFEEAVNQFMDDVTSGKIGGVKWVSTADYMKEHQLTELKGHKADDLPPMLPASFIDKEQPAFDQSVARLKVKDYGELNNPEVAIQDSRILSNTKIDSAKTDQLYKEAELKLNDPEAYKDLLHQREKEGQDKKTSAALPSHLDKLSDEHKSILEQVKADNSQSFAYHDAHDHQGIQSGGGKQKSNDRTV